MTIKKISLFTYIPPILSKIHIEILTIFFSYFFMPHEFDIMNIVYSIPIPLCLDVYKTALLYIVL